MTRTFGVKFQKVERPTMAEGESNVPAEAITSGEFSQETYYKRVMEQRAQWLEDRDAGIPVTDFGWRPYLPPDYDLSPYVETQKGHGKTHGKKQGKGLRNGYGSGNGKGSRRGGR